MHVGSERPGPSKYGGPTPSDGGVSNGGLYEIACHPFGHLRDLIAFAGSHCLPVGYFILRDFGTRFVGRLWTLELVRLVPLNVLDC